MRTTMTHKRLIQESGQYHSDHRLLRPLPLKIPGNIIENARFGFALVGPETAKSS